MNRTLRNGAPVTILAGSRFVGYRGHVTRRDGCDRFYELNVTHDADGNRLKKPFPHGLYARRELSHNPAS